MRALLNGVEIEVIDFQITHASSEPPDKPIDLRIPPIDVTMEFSITPEMDVLVQILTACARLDRRRRTPLHGDPLGREALGV